MRQDKIIRPFTRFRNAVVTIAVLICGPYFSSPLHAQELTVGLIPAESNEEMITAFEPMRVYLEECLEEKQGLLRLVLSSLASEFTELTAIARGYFSRSSQAV